MIRRDSPWMMLIPVTNNRGGNEDSEQIFPLRPSRLECNFGAMTSAAGKNETSHHPSDLLSSKIGCSNEISVLHWKQVLCWSHLGCIRTKFLKSWFHVIDDYRLKFFSSAGLPWSPTSNSLIHHECSQLTSTARIKVSLWSMYSWTTFKRTRLLCTMFLSRFVKALWSCSILQLLVTKKWRKNWSWSSRNITSQKRASPIIIFLPSQLVVGLLGKLYRIYRDRNIIMFWSSSY